MSAAGSYGTPGGRDGHSAIDAVAEAARLVADGRAGGLQVLQLAMPGTDQVKLIGSDGDGRHVYYTECSRADAERILDVFGTREVTDELAVLADSLGYERARETMRALRKLDVAN